MEQPRAGGGTAARAAEKKTKSHNKQKRPQDCGRHRQTNSHLKQRVEDCGAQLDGQLFKMKGVSVSRKRPPDGGGTSILTQNRA